MTRAGALLWVLGLAGALAAGTPAAAAQPTAAPPGPARPVQAPSAAPGGGKPGAGPGSLTATSAAERRGPRVALSYRLYSLRDDLGGRRVHTGGFAGFLPTRFIRAGGGVEAGIRTHEFGEQQGVVSGNVFVGYQHLRDLGPLVPYLVALGELGVVLQKRFHTPQSEAYRGAGLELGADVKLVRSLYMGLGVSFMLYTMDGLAYDTFGLRLSIGL
jgi:hypothetical protein